MSYNMQSTLAYDNKGFTPDTDKMGMYSGGRVGQQLPRRLGPVSRVLVPLSVMCIELFERMTYFTITAGIMFFVVQNLNYNINNGGLLTLAIFSGAAYLTAPLGGLLADRYLGRFNTILGATAVYIAGLALLVTGSYDTSEANMEPFDLVHRNNMTLSGLILIVLGTGGIKANVAPFGADQIRSLGDKVVTSYFNWYYFVINLGSLVAVVGVSHLQTPQFLGKGLLIPLCGMAASLLLFAVMYTVYEKYWAEKINMCSIICAGCCKSEDGVCCVPAMESRGGDQPDHAVVGFSSAFKTGLLSHFLVLMWIGVALLAMASPLQSARMDRSVGNYEVPEYLYRAFPFIAVLCAVPILTLIVFPCFGTKRKFGLTLPRRVGLGLLLVSGGLLTSAVVEKQRLDTLGPANYTNFTPSALILNYSLTNPVALEITINITKLEMEKLIRANQHPMGFKPPVLDDTQQNPGTGNEPPGVNDTQQKPGTGNEPPVLGNKPQEPDNATSVAGDTQQNPGTKSPVDRGNQASPDKSQASAEESQASAEESQASAENSQASAEESQASAENSQVSAEESQASPDKSQANVGGDQTVSDASPPVGGNASSTTSNNTDDSVADETPALTDQQRLTLALNNTSKEFRDFFRKTQPGLTMTLWNLGLKAETLRLVMSSLPDLVPVLNEMQLENVKVILDALPDLLGPLDKLPTENLKSIFAMLPKLLQPLDNLSSENITFILNTMPAMINLISNSSAEIQQAMLGVFPDMLPLLAGIDPNQLQTLLAIFPGFLDRIENLSVTVVKPFMSLLPQLLPRMLALTENQLMQLTDMLPSVFELLRTVPSEIQASFIDLMPSMLPLFMTLTPEERQSLMQTLPGLLQIVTDSLSPEKVQTLLGMLPDLLPEVLPVLPQILAMMKNASPEMLQTLQASLPALLPVLLEIPTENLMPLVKKLPVLLPVMIPVLLEIPPENLMPLVKKLPSLLPVMMPLLPQIMEMVSGIPPALLQSFQKVLPDILPQLLSTPLEMLTPMMKALPVLLPGMMSQMEGIPPQVLEAMLPYLPNLLPILATEGFNVVQGLVADTLAQAFPRIVAHLEKNTPDGFPLWELSVPLNVSSISVFAQIPHILLVGLGEAMAAVAGLELAYHQVPFSMQGLVTGLYVSAMGVGSFCFGFLLNAIDGWTEECNELDLCAGTWFSPAGGDINNQHLHYMYFLVSAIVGGAFLLYAALTSLCFKIVDPITFGEPVDSELPGIEMKGAASGNFSRTNGY